eukprot:3363866-Amphidinium_carterae.1
MQEATLQLFPKPGADGCSWERIAIMVCKVQRQSQAGPYPTCEAHDLRTCRLFGSYPVLSSAKAPTAMASPGVQRSLLVSLFVVAVVFAAILSNLQAKRPAGVLELRPPESRSCPQMAACLAGVASRATAGVTLGLLHSDSKDVALAPPGRMSNVRNRALEDPPLVGARRLLPALVGEPIDAAEGPPPPGVS